MRTLSNVAVFGLLPIPSIAATRNGDDVWTAAEEISDALQRAYLLDGITERMATKDELARIRCELGQIDAESNLLAAAASERKWPFTCMTWRICRPKGSSDRPGGDGVADPHQEQLS